MNFYTFTSLIPQGTEGILVSAHRWGALYHTHTPTNLLQLCFLMHSNLVSPHSGRELSSTDTNSHLRKIGLWLALSLGVQLSNAHVVWAVGKVCSEVCTPLFNITGTFPAPHFSHPCIQGELYQHLPLGAFPTDFNVSFCVRLISRCLN